MVRDESFNPTPEQLAEINAIRAEINKSREIDPLDDFEVFHEMRNIERERGYNKTDIGPTGAVIQGLKGGVDFVANIGQALGELAGGKAVEIAETIAGNKEEADRLAGERLALISSAGGRLMANTRSMFDAASNATQRVVNYVQRKLEDDPAKLKELQVEDDKLIWNQKRAQREGDQIKQGFNKMVEDWTGATGFGNIPVNERAAEGLASVADPTNFIPLKLGANALKVPMAGAVKKSIYESGKALNEVVRAEQAVNVAKLAATEATNAAEKQVAEGMITTAKDNLQKAAAAKQQVDQAAAKVIEQQAVEIQASKSIVGKAAGKTAQGVGTAVEKAGEITGKINSLPTVASDYLMRNGKEDLALSAEALIKAAPTAMAAGSVISAGVGLPTLGMVLPLAAQVGHTFIKDVGKSINAFGRLLMEGEGQVPFFLRLANETKGVPRFMASMMDRTGLAGIMESGGRMVKASAMPAAAGGAFGTMNAIAMDEPYEAIKGAVTGGMLGMAGSALGEWRRYDNPDVFRMQQVNDLNRYRQTINGMPDQAKFFDGLPRAERTAIATYAQAYPDLQIRYTKGGKGADGTFYIDEGGNPIAEINMESQTPISAILAHEIGHHIQAHGMEPMMQRELLGDPETMTPGMFTKVDGNKLVTTKEFDEFKGSYNSKLVQQARATGDKFTPVDDLQVAREMFAEYAAGKLLDSKDFQRKRRNFTSDKLLESLVESPVVKSLGFMQGFLGKMGVPFAKDGSVIGTGLFENLKNSKEISKMIDEYNRKLNRGEKRTDIDEEPGRKVTYTPEEVDKTIADKFKASGDLKVDPKTGEVKIGLNGKPEYNTPEQVKKINAEMCQVLSEAIEQNPGVMREVNSSDGKTWYTGRYLPDEAIAKLEKLGRFNPEQIKNLKMGNDILQKGTGEILSMLYQARSTAGSKNYKTLAARYMTVSPFGVRFAKDGNVLFEVFSPEQLSANIDKAIKRKRLGEWDNNRGKVLEDVYQYLRNHAEDKPGAAVIGETKRDLINELMGIRIKEAAGRNPLFEAMQRPNKDSVVKQLRLDGIIRMSPVDGRNYKFDYTKVKFNYRPRTPTEPEQVAEVQ